MKVSRRGFTLIELLAVIVILAIIALIATPLILNVIDQAREGAAKNSAYGYANAVENYANAVENYLALEQMNNPNGVAFDGPFTSTNISVKGNKPTSVSLYLSKGTVTGGFIIIDGYKSYFDNDGKIYTVEKVS